MADSFRLARSTVIAAPPKTVHALVNDFHRWAEWSPWEKMDAPGDMKKSFAGPEKGVGAVYGWVGKKTGEGRMEITHSSPESILIQLDFIKPMKANHMTNFRFTPEGQSTRVEWVMTGAQTLFMKFMHFFFSMEKMVGPQFEQGLADMKRAAEAAPPAPVSKAVTETVPSKPAAKKTTAKPAAKPKATVKASVAKAASKPEAAKPAAKAKAPAKTATPKAAAKPVAKAAPAKAAKPKAAPAAKPAKKKT